MKTYEDVIHEKDVELIAALTRRLSLTRSVIIELAQRIQAGEVKTLEEVSEILNKTMRGEDA